jgi:hypothetical protein
MSGTNQVSSGIKRPASPPFLFPRVSVASSNMTPTRTARTDTALQQRRRAFNSISLNNTRSDVHSSEKAGRGACSTVASRVNNEQRSNNTGRDHRSREQLLSWLMSKDAVASCFIKDVLSMSESEHAGGTRLLAWLLSQTQQATGLSHYFLGRVPCRSISLVAVVVGATAYERRIVYIREPYYLPLSVPTPKLVAQWMMEPAPSTAHFASVRARISQKAKRVKFGTIPVTPAPQLENGQMGSQVQVLVLTLLSSQSVPWSMSRAKSE